MMVLPVSATVRLGMLTVSPRVRGTTARCNFKEVRATLTRSKFSGLAIIHKKIIYRGEAIEK